MPNQIIPVVWEKPLRKSAVNTLDKLNEVINFINTSDIHEFSFIDGDTGREVVSGTSTQLATLDVFGESVQDGTPTPDNPVPVRTVNTLNIVNYNTPFEVTKTSDSAQVLFTMDLEEKLTAGDKVAVSLNAYENIDITQRVFFYIGNRQGATGFDPAQVGTGTVNLTIENDRHTVILEATGECTALRATLSSGTGTAGVTVHAEYVQVEIGETAHSYMPYGYIGPQIGNDITPIDLQGHVLASLPDGTQDLLRVDSAGVKGIEQYINRYRLTGTESYWNVTTSTDYEEFTIRTPNVLGIRQGTPLRTYISTFTNQTANNRIVAIDSATYTTLYWRVPTESQAIIGTTIEQAKEYVAANDCSFLYPLAESIHHNLGVMDMPTIPSGSVIKIAATLEPEFDIQWWTESAIPSVINGLKAYVDEQIETVNARIDELHGISRATVVRPDATVPAIEFEPIEKITVNDDVETNVEKEN